MGCGAVFTYAGGQKSESLSPWSFQSCSMDVRLGTLTKYLRWRLNSFDTRSLRRVLGYHWSYFVSTSSFGETQVTFVSCVVCEHQLQLYGHVAHFPDANPAHKILSVREPREWRRPAG